MPMSREQIHKRLNTKAVKFILQAYEQGKISRETAMFQLGVKTNRFHAILKSYCQNPENFDISYSRKTTNYRLSKSLDRVIRHELNREKAIIDNPKIAIRRFNFEATRLEVIRKTGVKLSAQTIRNRAIDWSFYRPKSAPGPYREVETTAIGYLFQHDSSLHYWSPYITFKFYLILTTDDYSRKIVYAKFVAKESSWEHILAAREVSTIYGVGLAYYVDNHSIFRFICHGKSIWQNQCLKTDEGFVQWKEAVKRAGWTVWYAPKANAKGKVERKFRYLLDRILRRCAKEEVKTIEEAQRILDEEVHHYNCEHVHKETGEIPEERWQKAIRERKNLLKPLRLRKDQSLKDIFCLELDRVVGAYGKISFENQSFSVPKLRSTKVLVHYLPDEENPELRIIHQGKVIKIVKLKKSS
jgi:hypothetical protein